MHIELSAILPSLPHRRAAGQEGPHKATDLLGKVRENSRGKNHDQDPYKTVETAPTSSPNRLETPGLTRRLDSGKQLSPGAAVKRQNAEQRLPDRGIENKPSTSLGVPAFDDIQLPFVIHNVLTPFDIPHQAIRGSASAREGNSSSVNSEIPQRPLGIEAEGEDSPKTAVPSIPSRLLVRMAGKPKTPQGGRNFPSVPNQHEVPEIAKDLIERLRSHMEGKNPSTSRIPENALRAFLEKERVQETIVEWATQLIREGVPHRTVFHVLHKLFDAEHEAETRTPSTIAPENALDLHKVWERIVRGRHTHVFDQIEHVERRENEPTKAWIAEPSVVDFEVEKESIEKPTTPRSEDGVRHLMPSELSPHAVSPSTPESRAVQRIETRPLMNAVIERLQEMLESKREKTVTIQLDPPELGKLSITVRTQGKRVETEILVSHPDVRTVLEANREQLVHALNSRGLHLGGMHIGSQANPHRESLPSSVTPMPPVWRQEGISKAGNLHPHSLIWFRTSGLDFSV